MTTSNKNFKVKNGLEVLGTSATVDGNDILTTVSNIEDLANVDTTGAVAGNALVFDSSLNLVPGEGGGSGGGSQHFISDTKPLDANEGDTWFHSTTGATYIYYVDVDSEQWIQMGEGLVGPVGPQGLPGSEGAQGDTGPAGPRGVVVQSEPPSDIAMLWVDPDEDGIGVPLGGTEGQILVKVDDTDLNTTWADNSAESTFYLVRNNTGSTISKGTLVSATGAEPSGRVDVGPFETTGLQDSELRVMGVATSNISNGHNGTVMSFGTLKSIDTRGTASSAIAVGDETWAEGDILYAHPTVAGKLTNVRPQHDLAVAFITVRHQSSGQIAVRIIPSNSHLEWLHDVEIDTATAGDLIVRNSANTLWENATLAEAGISEVGHDHDDRYYTESETDTAISNAIAGLVDTAPATLDTLNELAAALGDDENFATTVTTALSGKSDTSHTHDDIYYTESETDTLLNEKANLSGATFTGEVGVEARLSVSALGGDEGGEITLAKPITNSTIDTGVNIDLWQNRFRIFEQGGSNRGYYLDIPSARSSVSTRISTNQFVASSSSQRDNYWGAGSLDLQNLGAQTIRTDKGWTEQYYHTYNASTNPGGTTPAGWYPVSGNLPKGRKIRNGTGYNFTLGAWHTFPNSTYWQDEFTPWEVNFDSGRWIPTIPGIYNCNLGNFNNGISFTIQTIKKNSMSADGVGQIATVTPLGSAGWNAGSVDRTIKLLTTDYIFWSFYASSNTSSGTVWNTGDSGNSYFGIEYVSPPFGA